MVTAFISVAQPPTKFYCTYGGNGYDVGYDVKQTFDGGYIITGSTSSFGQGNTDMYLLKLDSMGQVKFERSFGGLNNEIGKSVVQLSSDSGYVMAGYTSSSGVGGYDMYLVKADKNGNLVWQKTFGGSDWDFAHSLQATTDGGFIIGGTTYSFGNGSADGYVVKTNANGDTLWTKTYGGANDDEFKSIIQTADGNYATTGYTKSYNDVDSGDVWVFKLNTTGDTLWRKFYGGSKEDFGNEIIEHPVTSDYYVVGGTRSYGASLNHVNAYSLWLNSIGNQLHQTLDNTSSSYAEFSSIVISSRSPYVVNTIIKQTFVSFSQQTKMLEMNLGLDYINATDFGSTLNDECYKIISTKDKGYACIGFTQGFGAVLSNCYFIKVDSNLIGGNYSIVSVNERSLSNATIALYPNPAKNEFNLTSSVSLKKIRLKMVDNIGRELSLDQNIQFVSDNKVIINTEVILDGVYFLIINDKALKIVIQH